MDIENWCPVVGFEDSYSISDRGRVRSEARIVQRSDGRRQPVPSRLLRTPVDHKGYPRANLYRNNVGVTRYVHQMMMESFVGQPDATTVIRHLNGDSRDNRLANLTYGTVSDNQFDTRDHGRNRNANKTHCARGHAFSVENTRVHTWIYVCKDGTRSSRRSRICRACRRRIREGSTWP